MSLGLKKLARLCEELSLSGEIVAGVLDNLPADLFLAYKSRTQDSSGAVAYDQQRNCIGPLFGERGLVIDSAAFGDDTSPATASFVSRSYAKNHEPKFLEFSIDEFDTLPKTPLARSDVQTGLSPYLHHSTHMKPTYDVPCTQQIHADATRESIHRLYDHFAAGPAHQPVDVGKVAAADGRAAVIDNAAFAASHHHVTGKSRHYDGNIIHVGHSRPVHPAFRLLPADMPGDPPTPSCPYPPGPPAATPCNDAAWALHGAGGHGWEEAASAPQKREVDPSFLAAHAAAAARRPRSPRRPFVNASAAGIGGGVGGAGGGKAAVPKLWCSGQTPRRDPDSDTAATEPPLRPHPAVPSSPGHRAAAAASHGGGGGVLGGGGSQMVTGDTASSPGSPARSRSSESDTSTTDAPLTDRIEARRDGPLRLALR